jgi:hypothetical protein
LPRAATAGYVDNRHIPVRVPVLTTYDPPRDLLVLQNEKRP